MALKRAGVVLRRTRVVLVALKRAGVVLRRTRVVLALRRAVGASPGGGPGWGLRGGHPCPESLVSGGGVGHLA